MNNDEMVSLRGVDVMVSPACEYRLVFNNLVDASRIVDRFNNVSI